MPITTPLESRFHRPLHYSLLALCPDRNRYVVILPCIRQDGFLLATESGSLNQVSRTLFWLISEMWFPMFPLMSLHGLELDLPSKKNTPKK